ncbi:MAG TPA: type IV pilus modification protein PilV [Accumulibacter sp.]|uniref:Type IV pilus modification protein PilV n=2 Tax=Candidatus Accumulibacter TaxID=327159 RepID=A0A080MB77_9PROT|nr:MULTISPECIES: type IV pilus modification protein PilV [Candidatus Accumulibacter]KFB77685.1 MAG: type IV pilus modification protein PilV [Candidatus Accumulibacter cognatus]MBL8399832.1 type IV pilus modification protein PilV [Accumulibacter sp.]MBN8517443.1 type IV pilus modification protein PilV [Accumulibacter sp.]MBO3710623.1 type IV pilus modification protein PilV [Accumulibacter sp.]MCC2868232.1 type IV pilus modification protein PilV [Candidatus Accumulibacter phosphatis]
MKFFQQATRGFTLLEVLISLLILMIALLGIAALMLKGQRAGFEAYQRQQALAMAQEMAEKIRANQGGAPFYVTGVTEGTGMPGRGGLFATYKALASDAKCLSGPSCTSQQIAQNHLATWDGVLAGESEIKDAATNRVGGIIGARGCIERPAATQPVFLVSVAWQGESDTVAPDATTASACGAGLYGTAARRRLVTLTVVTCQLNAAAPWGCS